MISYALIGAISAVVELASVALASAYVAQISRRRLREKQQSWVSRNALDTQVPLVTYSFSYSVSYRHNYSDFLNYFKRKKP